MKLQKAVLAGVVVGAVGIALAERRHRDRLRIDTAAMHQRLLADIATDPEHQKLWAHDGDDPGEMALFVRANRQLSLTQTMYRVRVLDDATLRVAAENLMKREGVRLFWDRFGAFRAQEAATRRDRHFVEITDQAHAAALAKAMPTLV